MARETVRDSIRALERAEPEEQWVLLCFLAGREVEVGEAEVHAAIRRSELLLAAGGDPHRRLELYGRGVTALADDLDAPERREQLKVALARLEHEVAGLRSASEALRVLRSDADLAWHCYAAALLAEDLASEDEPDE